MLPPPVPTGDSLLDFSGEDDTELDPLKRSDSTSSGFITKSGNFNFERTGSNASGFLTKSGNFNFGLSEAPPAHQTVGPTHQTVAPAHQTVGPTHAVSGGFPSTAVPANTGELLPRVAVQWTQAAHHPHASYRANRFQTLAQPVTFHGLRQYNAEHSMQQPV